MTFVTLSLRYAGPRIGLGSEFFARSCGALPRDSSKRDSSANRSANRGPDSEGVCVF